MFNSDKVNGFISEAINNYLDKSYDRLFYIDLDTDKFYAFKSENNSYEVVVPENNSFSGWFNWFCKSPLCHPDDSERLISFFKPDYLIRCFEINNDKSVSVIYRRKNQESDTDFHQSKVDFVPAYDNGKKGAMRFVRDVTKEFNAYQISLYERSRNDRIQNSPLSNQKRKLLIVDSNSKHTDELCEILGSDYDINVLADGNPAISELMLNYVNYSAVIIDVQNDNLGAEGFLVKLSDNPIISQVPVIAVTSNRNLKSGENCIMLGAVDFITRPYKAGILKSRIMSIIRLRESSAILSEVEYDELTGVYTRQAFYHHMNVMMKSEPDKNYRLAISDITEFKVIAEKYGKQNSDNLLRYIASFFLKMSELGALVGRYGNDQFAIFTEYSPLFSDEVVVMNFRAACKTAPLPDITVKMGIYDNVDTSLTPAQRCDRALTALDSIKHKFGEIIGKYDTELIEKINKKAMIELSMQSSLENNNFDIYYQPKHDTVSGKVIGAEALIRWNHPELGFMSPREFIPVFEGNGFISEADLYVFRKACEHISEWNKEGVPVVPVSVNCSRLDFIREDFIEDRIQRLNEYSVSPEMIHFEITESHFTDYVEKVEVILRECREKGFKIELDDFGTGYSSLNTLSTVPLDYVKLDRSLMDDIDNTAKRNVLSVTLNLIKLLKLKSVVEGVETKHQLDVLREIGCDCVQGYFYSEPLSKDDFRQYLIEHNS